MIPDLLNSSERDRRYYSTALRSISRKTITARRAAKDLGTAGHAARTIYSAISEVIETSYDPDFQHRLLAALQGVIAADRTRKSGEKVILPQHLKQLKKLRVFNPASITVKTKVKRNRGGSIQVQIAQPARQAPAAINYIEFRAVAVMPNLRHGYCRTMISSPFILSKSEGMPELTLDLPSQAVRACLVILEAKAYKLRDGNLVPVAYQAHNAADVIAVLPPMKKIARRKAKKVKVSEKTAAYWAYVMQRKDFGGMQEN